MDLRILRGGVLGWGGDDELERDSAAHLQFGEECHLSWKVISHSMCFGLLC